MISATYFEGLVATLVLSILIWLISLYKRDVSVVDSAWSLLFIAAMYMYLNEMTDREWLVLSLVLIWAIRLCIHITARSWGEEEDSRYQDIRKKYSPGFAFKSLFIIFVFQAILAWIISLPLFAIFSDPAPISILTIIAAAIVLIGICFESIADIQLMRFKSDPVNQGKVMDGGLWRYSRHPNYFGEAVIWWGFTLFALEQGYWWSLLSPILLTYLLLRFSGVHLMESTIVERRPNYRAYIETTNAFFPGPKKLEKSIKVKGEHS